MKKLRIVGLAALALFLVLPAGRAGEEETTSAEGSPLEIEVSAKKYEFKPNVITVKKGQPVRLVLTATDRDHGFKIEALKIEVALKKGVPTPVEFTAETPGRYEFKCSKFCGFGHGRMKGELVVEE